MRRFIAVAVIVFIASAGCHMCASPYDYCSPVVESYDGPEGDGAWSDSGSEMASRNMPQRNTSYSQLQQQPQQGPALAGYSGGQ